MKGKEKLVGTLGRFWHTYNALASLIQILDRIAEREGNPFDDRSERIGCIYEICDSYEDLIVAIENSEEQKIVELSDYVVMDVNDGFRCAVEKTLITFPKEKIDFLKWIIGLTKPYLVNDKEFKILKKKRYAMLRKRGSILT